jgi:NADPH:quinone reductase-like Zn-dependent oxidoreductase
VESVQVGDRVVVDAFVPCGVCGQCGAGQPQLCRRPKLVGQDLDGGYAEFTAVPAANLVTLPASWSFTRGAASLTPYVTAWHMLRSVTNVGTKSSVGVLGASGAVGTAVIQLCLALGAKSFAVSGTAGKREALSRLGATDVWADQGAFESWLLERTGGRGCDVVCDPLVDLDLTRSLRSLSFGGTLVVFGRLAGWNASVDVRYLFSRELKIAGSRRGGHAEFAEVIAFLDERAIQPVIDSVLSLEEVEVAHRRLADREAVGSIVLRPEAISS